MLPLSHAELRIVARSIPLKTTAVNRHGGFNRQG